MTVFQWRSLVSVRELIDELLQRHEFPPLDEAELLHKEDEMLEGCVQVCLFTQLHHLCKMLVINMRVYL